METLTLLFILLAASYILGEAFRKVRLPRVIGPILVGMVLNTGMFRYILINAQNEMFLRLFSNLGLIFLMFYVGLELDLKAVFRRPKQAVYISVFNLLVPFIITFLVMKILGYSDFISLIIGITISITAEAISVDILREIGILKSKIGEIIVLAATFDDVVEVLFLSGLSTYIGQNNAQPEAYSSYFVFYILIFFTAIYATRFLLFPFIIRFLGKDDSKSQLFVVGILMVLMVTILSESLGFGALIGALIAGIVVKYTMLEAKEYKKQKNMTALFEGVTFGFLAPFFFIWVGFRTDVSILGRSMNLGLILTFLAISTKLLGSLIGNYISRGRPLHGLAIGFAMANKGVVELVAAEMARTAGLISTELFSAIVFMTVMTTIISPIMFGWILKYIKKQPKESRHR